VNLGCFLRQPPSVTRVPLLLAAFGGYAAVVLLVAVVALSAFVLVGHAEFSPEVVLAASTAAFVDLLVLLGAVWKIT
jgi:hypothetical protein